MQIRKSKYLLRYLFIQKKIVQITTIYTFLKRPTQRIKMCKIFFNLENLNVYSRKTKNQFSIGCSGGGGGGLI